MPVPKPILTVCAAGILTVSLCNTTLANPRDSVSIRTEVPLAPGSTIIMFPKTTAKWIITADSPAIELAPNSRVQIITEKGTAQTTTMHSADNTEGPKTHYKGQITLFVYRDGETGKSREPVLRVTAKEMTITKT